MSGCEKEVEVGDMETIPARGDPSDDELVQIEIPLELADFLSSGKGLSEGGVVQRFCRVCLHAGADMKCIFAGSRAEQLAEMLASFTHIQVASGDGMPSKVCSGCRDLIIQSYIFKQKCERSDTAIRAFLHGDIVYNIKSEVDEVNGPSFDDAADSMDSDKDSFTSELEPKPHLKFEIDMVIKTESEMKYSDSQNCMDKSKKKLITQSEQTLKKKEKKNVTDKNKTPKKERESCDICGKSFKDAEKLAEHTEEAHLPEFPGKCEFCHKNFKSERGLRQHMKSAHCESKTERPYKCSRCELSFLSEKDLTIHSSIHADGSLTCYACHKKFTTLLQLKRHIKRHMDEKQYKCVVCSKTFCEVSALYRHQRSHFGTAVEKKHECRICNKKFAEKSLLTVHTRRHTGERPYVCVKCGKDFLSARLLNSHMRTHTEHKPYKCNLCEKSFRHTATLATHRRTHTGERPYVCSVCGKAFIQSSNLTLHSRVHSGERPYACSVCGTRFSSWSTMKAHERIHTGEKPYSCNICGQRFARMDLRAHMRRHGGERMFTCALCGKSFFTSLRLAEHSRLHSGIMPFECGLCGSKLGTKASYLRHVKRHHAGNSTKTNRTHKPKPFNLGNIEFNQSESTETSALQICDYVDGAETIIDQSGNINEGIQEEPMVKYEEDLVPIVEVKDIEQVHTLGVTGIEQVSIVEMKGIEQVPSVEVNGIEEVPIAGISDCTQIAMTPLTVDSGKERRLRVFRIESSGGQLIVSDVKSTSSSNHSLTISTTEMELD